jgi:hypothetical protein
MAGDYSQTQMLNVFELLGRDTMSEEFSEFQNEEKGNLETLRLLSDNSPLCYPNQAMRSAFNKKTSPSQTVYVDVSQTVAAGTGTQSVRIGSGGASREEVAIVGQTPIQEGFSISRVNESMSRFNVYSPEERVRLSMAFNLGHAMQNVMVRAEKQAQAWLDTIKWTGGGIGNIFAVAGDYKSIPAAQDDEVFWKITTEARQNKFSKSGINVLGSDYLPYMLGTTKGYGEANQKNLQASLDQITPYVASELSVPTPATDQALIYAIAKGGVGMISHAHKYTENEFSNGQDTWMTSAISDMPMFEGINADLVELQVKGYNGWVDNFATYANDASRIDIVQAISLVATFHFFSAYSPTARTPVVGYIKLK